MTNLELELSKTRLKWLEAHKRGDSVMCSLWEKVGKHLKFRIQERLGTLEATTTEIENIFGGKLQE